tara:strand:- start:324 stop:854 length:531 start_codon:yes stop_codon:yes gene_type:complete
MLEDINLRDELNKFAKFVIQQARSRLTKSGKRDTSSLYNSLGSRIEKTANDVKLSFLMNDYGDFVDKGVRGKESSAKAPNSPYRFGSGTGAKGGLRKGISSWVERKRIQFRDKKGRFISYKRTSFLISRSIYRTGIRPSMFFTKPFEQAFAKLPDDLIRAYSVGIEKQLNVTIKEK